MRFRQHIWATVGFIFAVGGLFAQEKFVVEAMPFNSDKFREYSPTIVESKLVFSSDRKSDLFLTHTVDSNLRNLTNLFEIELTDPSNVALSELASRKKIPYHIGAGQYDSESKHFFFTRNIGAKKRGHDREEINNLGIFYIDYSGEEAGDILEFEYNSKNTSCAHPMARMMDGYLTLVYASDMEGGEGMSDLYMSQHVGGRWTVPKHLGKGINTGSRDVFPFMDKNFDLYFSSSRPGGSGGLDLYLAKWNGTWWNSPTRLDTSINSTKDDFGLIMSGKESGYFSSNRNGSDDIYSFRMEYPTFEACDSIRKVYLCYDFFEESSVGIDTLPLIYEWNFGDGSSVRALETEHCFPGPGDYTIQLNVVDTVIDQVFMNEATFDLTIEDIMQPFISSRDTVAVGEEVFLSASDTKWDAFEISEYYWDFGNGIIKKGESVTHRWDSAGMQIVTLGIVSAPDSAGQYQKECSYKGVAVIDSAAQMKRFVSKLMLRVISETNEPLKGGIVELYSKDGLIDTLVTNSDGEVLLDSTQLEDGSYLKLKPEEKGLQMLVVEGDDVIHRLKQGDSGFEIDKQTKTPSRMGLVEYRMIKVLDTMGVPQPNKRFFVRTETKTIDTLITDENGYLKLDKDLRTKLHWLKLDPEEEGLEALVMEEDDVLFRLKKEEKGYLIEPKIFKVVRPEKEISADLEKMEQDSIFIVRVTPDSTIVEKVYKLELMRSDTSMKELRKFDYLLYPVTEITNDDSTEFIYTIGESTDPLTLRKQFIHAQERGFTKAKIKEFEGKKELAMKSNTVLKDKEPLLYQPNKVFKFNNVYFNSSKYDILPESAKEIDKIVKTMKDYPGLKVHLMAHADSTDTKPRNLTLTRNRANSVKRYMQRQGINSTRIKATGYGESMPIATNETEEGKALNRRVEFVFIEKK